jgi:uncharacterized lipoprotein YmbA
VPANRAVTAAPGAIALGLGQVKIPAYLFSSSLAVRRGTNEIEYLPSAFWAERLDSGFQRVLAANLAILLPTDRIWLSAWRKSEVMAEVYVTLEQFDVSASGRGVLVARWRILSPGGDKVLKAGSSRLSREGPPPDPGVSESISTLNELIAGFAGQLALALKEATSPPQPASLSNRPEHGVEQELQRRPEGPTNQIDSPAQRLLTTSRLRNSTINPY